MSFYVGTAGWTIPKAVRDAFPAGDSALARYASHFRCTEINSSFYRPHRRSTYERWAQSVPAGFRFSLKVPKAITHEQKLVRCESLLEVFLDETSALGAKLGVYLVQLAPSHAYDDNAAAFFAAFRDRWHGGIACEPRHLTWLSEDALAMLRSNRITVAGADPAKFDEGQASLPFGDFAYYRWHGSPRVYYSAYEDDCLERFALEAKTHEGDVWCIFDNTAMGAAAGNALAFERLVR